MKKDTEILIAMVQEMAASNTGAQSTKDWSADALWFDIPPFASKGIGPAKVMFDSVFANFSACRISILETETIVEGGMGIVCTVQKADITFKNDTTKTLLIRQTDCFRKFDDRWLLVHQHASVPFGGEWDGKIVTQHPKSAPSNPPS